MGSRRLRKLQRRKGKNIAVDFRNLWGRTAQTGVNMTSHVLCELKVLKTIKAAQLCGKKLTIAGFIL